MSDRRTYPLSLDAAATLGLALYSLVAALGLGRVFSEWTFVGDAVAIVVVGHGLSLLGRRLGVPGVLAVAVQIAVLAALVGWLFYPDTYAAVFPTASTWDIANADIQLVRDQFSEAVAPVAYVGGWSALAGLGTAVVVVLADAFAFRANGNGEALVPAGVLFVFIAAIGVDRDRVAFTLALVAAGVIAIATLRTRAARPPRTVLGASRHPLVATLPAAGLAGLAIVAGAWAIGPRLPGAGDEALVDTKGRGGGTTEVVSPLVDIRSRLVNRSARELFTVAAPEESYWRVSSLPQFDGRSWGLPSRPLAGTDGQLNEARPGALLNEQTITITALGGRLVPAAADPINADGEGLRFNAETSTLVRTDRALEPGDEFTVVSAMPVYSADDLRLASSVAPPDPIYLELPEDFPEVVGQTATEVTAGAPTTFDAVRALQDWFRSVFTYSLEVPSGHGNSAIEGFLRTRVGYCEQFAGTMAAMARTLGIPARVAVGFTPGSLDETGAYSVLGRNAHAWPEIWFDGYGWVPFEPTPGRGAPRAEAWTGVPAAQDTGTGGTDGESGESGTPTGTAPPVTGPATSLPRQGQLPDEGMLPGVVPPQGGSDSPGAGDGGGPWRPLLIVGGILAVAVAAPPAVRWLRRRRAGADAGDVVLDLWHRATRAVAGAGIRLDPTMTPLEQARHASPRLPVASKSFVRLAEAATAAAYASPEQLAELALDPDDPSDGPRRWCREVEEVAVDSLSSGGRIRRYFTQWE